MNSCADCKYKCFPLQLRYIACMEWRCSHPKYTNDVGGRMNYLSCKFVRHHDGYNHCTSWEKK